MKDNSSTLGYAFVKEAYLYQTDKEITDYHAMPKL